MLVMALVLAGAVWTRLAYWQVAQHGTGVLESSDVSRLPAPVYSRGFIRAYSRHLGLDPDEMINAYLADVAPEKKREVEGPRRGGLRARFLRGRR